MGLDRAIGPRLIQFKGFQTKRPNEQRKTQTLPVSGFKAMKENSNEKRVATKSGSTRQTNNSAATDEKTRFLKAEKSTQTGLSK